MNRETLREKRQRRRRQIMLQNCLKVALCVGGILALVTVIWSAAKPSVGQEEGRREARTETKTDSGTGSISDSVTGSESSSASISGSGSEPSTESASKAGTMSETEASSGSSSEDSSQTVEEVPPEQEDGSGQAGISTLEEHMTVTKAVPGWQQSDGRWWYATDQTTCYVNGWLQLEGNQYHFDSQGYMDTGWTPIGGQGYYFDNDGIYHPEADNSKMIALTYDDGPSQYTSQLLDVLEANQAQATFMMLGTSIENYGAETIPRMIQLGCTLGNHSYDHPDMRKLSLDQVRQQFTRTDELIAPYNNGAGASVIRFPYGEYTKDKSAATARPCFFWNIDTLDWDSQDANAIYNVVMSQVSGGDIVLLHDIYRSTVEASASFIPQLQAQGYQLVTLKDLAAAHGYRLESGVTYFSFTDTAMANDRVTDQNREAPE